jgi:hypothetical protein
MAGWWFGKTPIGYGLADDNYKVAEQLPEIQALAASRSLLRS